MPAVEVDVVAATVGVDDIVAILKVKDDFVAATTVPQSMFGSVPPPPNSSRDAVTVDVRSSIDFPQQRSSPPLKCPSSAAALFMSFPTMSSPSAASM